MRRVGVGFAGHGGAVAGTSLHAPSSRSGKAGSPHRRSTPPAHRFELQQGGHARERERRVDQIANARTEAEPEARFKAMREREGNHGYVHETNIQTQRQRQKNPSDIIEKACIRAAALLALLL